jgi:ABC-type antimicrobial peptide transport system permease subunit
MSNSSTSAIKGSAFGLLIGIGFGIAVLTTMGFDRMSLFEGLLLVSCAAFGGGLFGALIGVTRAFRREAEEVLQVTKPLTPAKIAGAA